MTLNEISHKLADMRTYKPRNIKRLFGTNGPTAEQLAIYNNRVRDWNNEYRKLSKLHKDLLAISNENFRKSRL